METIQEPVKPRSSSFNINAPSFVPPSRSRTPSFNNSTLKLDKSKYGKDNKLKRPRSKSMQVSMVPKEKHVYRAKVGNISMKSSKTDLADFFKQHFSDVKSTDFQPRYSEHGMMFGYVRCLCCSSSPVDLSCLKQKKVCWTAFSCPEASSTATRSRSRERTTRQASPHPPPSSLQMFLNIRR